MSSRKTARPLLQQQQDATKDFGSGESAVSVKSTEILPKRHFEHELSISEIGVFGLENRCFGR